MDEILDETTPVTKSVLNQAIENAKQEWEQELANRISAPISEASTRFDLTKYLIYATVIITLGVMVMAALKVEVPEIITGVILMGIFNTLVTTVQSYFKGRENLDAIKAAQVKP
jgi:uncharacterized membrane protein